VGTFSDNHDFNNRRYRGLGRDMIEALLATTPANEIAALARDVTKAADLAAQGVDVRPGDYFDYPSLVRAFQGIDTVLLVSTVVFTDRVRQHVKAINAAKDACVKHLFTPACSAALAT
jgi:NAD(P)H dehydrogenase (quinone)